MANIAGVSVNVEFSTDGTAWKTLICETENGVQISNSTTESQTKCDGGTIKTAIGATSWNFSFNAIADSAPQGTQVSYEDVLGWAVGKTLIHARIQSDATGATFYHAGQGYITDLNLTAATGSDVSFSGTFKGTGNIDIAP